MQPPHLSAVVLWEGWNDFYRRFYKGGIPETTFMWWLWDAWIKANHNPASGYIEPHYLVNAAAHPLLDEYWKSFETDLADIKAPALVCASFSDQGLHTRDTFEGFKKIGSSEKWLVNHRRPKWDAYYAPEGLELQRRFLDYYLKGEGTGLADLAPVTLEVNKTRTDFEVITRKAWPPEDTVATTLYLDLEAAELVAERPKAAAKLSYDSQAGVGLQLDYKIDKRLMIVGGAKVRLWVSPEATDDLDLFVALQKIDADGDQVFFYGFGGTNPNDVVARGWLRASHRELDQNASTELQPVHKHERQLKLAPSETVPVDIEILPSGTIFEPGETLRLIIQGRPIEPDAGLLGYRNLINSGQHHVHGGGTFDSCLVLPVLKLS